MKDVATKEDALGSIDFAKPAGLGAIFSSKQHVVRNKATVFSIGQRHQILSDDFLGALIVPHAATQNHQSVYLTIELVGTKLNYIFSINLKHYFVLFNWHLSITTAMSTSLLPTFSLSAMMKPLNCITRYVTRTWKDLISIT